MRLVSLLSVGLLTACVPSPGAEVTMNKSTFSATDGFQLPAAMNRFGLTAAGRPRQSNAEIARDFLELTFAMESGRPLPVFTRFEGQITVRMKGPVPPGAATDLARLLSRLRREAGLNVREIANGIASINIEFVPRDAIQTTFSNVACFVVPRVTSWAEFKGARRNGKLDWTTLKQRDQVSAFVPSDSSAQEVRDCLNEEIAQAMGPLNDLYRLTDSIFNDDNFRTTLTGFDMTILRAYYAPELRSGMNRAEVAARLPGILDRINPAGNFGGAAAPIPTPRFWVNSIIAALRAGTSGSRRIDAARQALSTARAQGWTDGRLAFSYFALGRTTLASDPQTAIAAFAEAGRIYRGIPGGEIHVAHVDMQLAAYALSRGEAGRAIDIANRAIPVVAAAENAALMATLMLVKSEALKMQGRGAEARAVRIDSTGWARYGFGSDVQVRARISEIEALGQRGRKS
tara:strand:- start:1640 stop:3016 length:1377 start_codon:yes stop_codon:yes gene_type:complete